MAEILKDTILRVFTSINSARSEGFFSQQMEKANFIIIPTLKLVWSHRSILVNEK